MSYQFKLLLTRVITDEEFAVLGKAGCTGSIMKNVSLPLDDSFVTRIDIDTEAANLEEAIQAALDAVTAVPDLKVTTLDVPAQPNGLPGEDKAEGENGHRPAALTAGSASDGAAPALDADPAGNTEAVTDAVVLHDAADADAAANGEAAPKGKTAAKGKAPSKAKAPS